MGSQRVRYNLVIKQQQMGDITVLFCFFLMSSVLASIMMSTVET